MKHQDPSIMVERTRGTGVACCLTIACQELHEQCHEPLSEDSLGAAYTLGRHFTKSICVPMQDCSGNLLRGTSFRPEVHNNHPGHLHATVGVVDNAWRDDGGVEMMNALLAAMEEAWC